MIVKKFGIASILLATAVSLVAPPLASRGDIPYAPQPQSSLQQMLSITWSPGHDLRQGIQDTCVGIVNNNLIAAGGYCYGLRPIVPENQRNILMDSPTRPGR